MRRILGAAAVMAALVGGSAGAAGAAPTNQPYNGSNCHGTFLAQFASAEPQGVGNFLGGRDVKAVQETVQSICAF